MGSALPSLQESEVMIFDSLVINNDYPEQKLIIKGHDIADQNTTGEVFEWYFDAKTVPLLSLQTLKSGDLLFWNDGELTPVPFDKVNNNIKVFRKVFK
tara:strand:+ start:7718 stop:8011 length:294 start_codon:yes stop_codon:yes gene_type:complete